MIDESSCNVFGRLIELDTLEKPEYYPLENVVFYTTIPFITNQVMSRLFHFLIADVGISFVSGDFTKKIMSMFFISLCCECLCS